jgi:hypothetical protein
MEMILYFPAARRDLAGAQRFPQYISVRGELLEPISMEAADMGFPSCVAAAIDF